MAPRRASADGGVRKALARYTAGMKAKLPLIISAAAVVAMCAFVFYMSALPADDSSALSTGVIWHIVGFVVPGYDQLSAAEQLQWQEALQNPVRKTAHFLEYAVLGALMLNLVRQIGKVRRNGLAASETGNGAPALDDMSLSDARQPGQPLRHEQPEQPDRPDGASGRSVLLAWTLTVAYAASDELHQLFVPGRAGRLSDIGIDAAGALLGIALLLFVLRLVLRLARAKRAAQDPRKDPR